MFILAAHHYTITMENKGMTNDVDAEEVNG